MEITYDYTQDIYYKRGMAAAQKQIEQEREKAKQEKIESIRALLAVGDFDNTQIADIMNVTESFVRKIANKKAN